MNIEILEYKPKRSRTKLGSVLVQYEQIVLKCELAYYVETKTPWTRMPETWISRDCKKKYAYWPTKEISDEFQKEVLKKLFEKYELDAEKIAEMHENNLRGHSEFKNV